jgi:hypothetical protein
MFAFAALLGHAVAVPQTAPGTSALPQLPAVEVELHNEAPVARAGIALTSLPLPRGALRTAADATTFASVLVEHGAEQSLAPALPLVRWPDGSIAVLQVHAHVSLAASSRDRARMTPRRAEDGSALGIVVRPHRPRIELPLPLWTELLDAWGRVHRAGLVPDPGAGPDGVVYDTGAVRLVRFRAPHRGVGEEVAGRPLLDLRAYFQTFDGEPRAELTLVLDNQEPSCGALGAVRFQGFKLCTADDRLRFLPAFAAENGLPRPAPRQGGGFEQWLLAPGDHYLGDGTGKAFRLHLFQDDGRADPGALGALAWPRERLIGLPALDRVRATRAFGAFGGPAPCVPDDPGGAASQLAVWRQVASFGPYGGFGDPENDALAGAPRSGDSMLHNVLRWRRPELLAAAEGMVLQHTLRPTAGRVERTPADTGAHRQGLLPLAQAAPHGFTAPGYEYVSALLLYDWYWLTGDALARDEMARLGGAVRKLLAAAPFRTSRGEGQCLLAGVLCARATGDAALLADLAAHARAVLLPILPGAGSAAALAQPPHPAVLDGRTRFDAPWQMAALVRGLAALHFATGAAEFAAAAVRIADAMAGPGWIDDVGPKTFVSAGDPSRYTLAALPEDRAVSDRMTIGAFALAAELAGDPATAARHQARAGFLLVRELQGRDGPGRQRTAADPWLQVALDRRERMQ